MKKTTLAQAYVFRATKRLKALEVLLHEESYSDVVREAQEVIELALKGLLREIGMDPPSSTMWATSESVGRSQAGGRSRPEDGRGVWLKGLPS
ncbi:MAG TPA: hypothetical protein DHW14_09495 [Clostridiales bacterium]|nr:hypothetical protein [Clostridiales bacterium]